MTAKGRSATKYGTYRTSTANGYVRLYRPGHPLASGDGYVLEHRYVVWEAGIDPRGKHVHHKNSDKNDNRPENLEVIDPSTHIRQHIEADGRITNQSGTYEIMGSLRGLEARRARAEAHPELIPHGTPTGRTNWGCTCEACKKAVNAYNRRKRAEAGRDQRFKSPKTNATEVVDIRRLKEEGSSIRDLAQRFGLSTTAIANIVNRRTWASV